MIIERIYKEIFMTKKIIYFKKIKKKNMIIKYK